MSRFSAFIDRINSDEAKRAALLFAYNFLATSIMIMGRIVRDTLFLNKYKGDRFMLSSMLDEFMVFLMISTILSP